MMAKLSANFAGQVAPALELIGLVKRFGTATVVDRVSLQVAGGEIVALLGPSGCGKTTTLRMIAGFETPDEGIIRVNGDAIDGLPTFRREMGIVFQDYALFPHMTVAGNIEYGMRKRGWNAKTRIVRREELMSLVRLEGLGDRRPSALSGGQQQRVALARALANRPRLLLLDEPLSNLDARLRLTLRNELREILKRVELTTVIVTHDQEEAMALADRIAVMSHGRILQVGTAREIYETPATRFVAEFVGRTIWFEGRVTDDPDGHGLRHFTTTDGFTFQVGSQPPTSEETTTHLAVRPENIVFNPAQDIENRMTALVVSREYLGSMTILHCTLINFGSPIAVPVPSDTPSVEIGTTVVLGFSARHAHVFRE